MQSVLLFNLTEPHWDLSIFRYMKEACSHLRAFAPLFTWDVLPPENYMSHLLTFLSVFCSNVCYWKVILLPLTIIVTSPTTTYLSMCPWPCSAFVKAFATTWYSSSVSAQGRDFFLFTTVSLVFRVLPGTCMMLRTLLNVWTGVLDGWDQLKGSAYHTKWHEFFPKVLLLKS